MVCEIKTHVFRCVAIVGTFSSPCVAFSTFPVPFEEIASPMNYRFKTSKSQLITLYVVILFNVINDSSSEETWLCSKEKAIRAFEKKILVNQWPEFKVDPYDNQTKESKIQIQETLNNKELVCGVKYESSLRDKYKLKQFANRKEAEEQGYIVTHQGGCGSCSSLEDLAVYIREPDLTGPVRKCALKGFVLKKWAVKCLQGLGFSNRCAAIWFYNTVNTRKHCFWICIKCWATNQPYNLPNGDLNPCLQCDEKKSGPVFKYFAGRTRRNSGIQSAIHRPDSQIYNMTHCYF